MAIRLAALDVDGTLLAPDNSITPATKEAIREAKAAGIEIVVCTGRAFVEVRDILRQLPEVRYLSCGTGAYALDVWTMETLYECSMPEELGKQAYRAVAQADCMVHFYTGLSVRHSRWCMDHFTDYMEEKMRTLMEQSHIIVDDLDAFVEMVDAVGGVDFDVPVEMYYDDPAQDLHIHFQPGMQHLSGQQALEVCRFRHNADGTGYPLGDVQRTETTQKMMLTVASKVMSFSGVTNLSEFVDIVQRNVETNLSGTDLAWFAAKGLGLNLSTGVSGGTLPGDGNVSYRGVTYCYELYPNDSLEMINQLVNPYTTDLTLEDVNIFQAP